MMETSIHPFTTINIYFHPADFAQEAGYTLDRFLVNWRADIYSRDK